MKLITKILALPAILAGLAIGCASGGGETGSETPQKSKPAKSAKAPEADEKAPQPASKPATRSQKPTTQKASSQPKKAGKFAEDAFPPTVSDVSYHKDAWYKDDCLRCHETGVGKAPQVRHESMLSDAQRSVLKTAKCRSCHVLLPGSKPREVEEAHDPRFDEDAFPPMIPASASHRGAWKRQDCVLCHENGIKGAPKAEHKSMLTRAQREILKTAKCRSCHVQVRAHENDRVERGH